MAEEPYKNREINQMFKTLEDKVDLFNEEHKVHHVTQKEKSEEILDHVKKTNGKVKKIIIALFFIFGILVGQTLSNDEIIKILLNLII